MTYHQNKKENTEQEVTEDRREAKETQHKRVGCPDAKATHLTSHHQKILPEGNGHSTAQVTGGRELPAEIPQPLRTASASPVRLSTPCPHHRHHRPPSPPPQRRGRPAPCASAATPRASSPPPPLAPPPPPPPRRRRARSPRPGSTPTTMTAAPSASSAAPPCR